MRAIHILKGEPAVYSAATLVVVAAKRAMLGEAINKHHYSIMLRPGHWELGDDVHAHTRQRPSRHLQRMQQARDFGVPWPHTLATCT